MKGIIYGKVPSKKNSRITTRSGRSFPNKDYTTWEKNALAQLAALDLGRVIDYPVRLHCKFYCPDLVGRDLDNMLSSVLDVLKDQKKRAGGKMVVVREGVVQDDSWLHIRPITIDAALDRINPRVEFSLDIEPMV